MHKTKLAFVSLLSLLVVLTPVSSALAQTKKVEGSLDQSAKQKAPRGNSDQTSVFQKIEKQGGEEVESEKLNKEKGKLGYWGTVGVAAAGGAIGGASMYSYGYARGYHGWDWSEFAGATIGSAAGAASSTATGMAGAASAVGTMVGGIVGDLVGGLW